MTEKEQVEFKNYFVAIFASNYLFQGIGRSLFAVIIPIYLIDTLGGIDITVLIASLGTLLTLPWTIKLLYGILSDKIGFKKYGRRRPWIMVMTSFAGVMWIILGTMNLEDKDTLFSVFLILGVLINLGVAFSDTVIDALVVDITPKEKLGRVNGVNWGVRSVGTIAGGPVIAILVISGSFSIASIFVIMGIIMIISSLVTIPIKEPSEYAEAKVTKHVKEMFNNSRDLKSYYFALFGSIADRIIFGFVLFYILLKMNLYETEGLVVSLSSDDPDIYMIQAIFTAVMAFGIIFGSIFGGQIADSKSRKFAVNIAYLLSTVTLLLMLIPVAQEVEFVYYILLIIIGFGNGARSSSNAAVLSQIAKQHPEMSGTYFSITTAMQNFGMIVGTLIGTLIMNITYNIGFDIYGAYLMTFIFFALFSNLGLIGFYTLKPKDYEREHILE